MGYIRIELGGSFPREEKSISAMNHGHAHAVTQAIEWLVSDVLPWAISRDHELHDEGARPSRGFSR